MTPVPLEGRLAALADAVPFALHYQVRLLGPVLPGPLVTTVGGHPARADDSAGHAGGRPTDADARPASSAVPAAPAGGRMFSRGADVVVPSFSTRKVSVLCATLALVRAGRLDLDRRLTVTEELKDGVQAGILRNLSAGIELSLRDCLAQMMATSDNICTQLVFEAIGSAAIQTQPVLPGTTEESAALQYVNDYCAWAGMRSTWHRETFPRTGDLTWSHPLDAITVTTAADQCHLLDRLARGVGDEAAAAGLQLTAQDCRFAIELMRGIYTPRLGAATTRIGFAEKNGRGLRSLSQVGIALGGDVLDNDGAPVAAVAVFAETIPTRLPDGRPGRNAVFDAFADVGLAVQDAVAPRMVA